MKIDKNHDLLPYCLSLKDAQETPMYFTHFNISCETDSRIICRHYATNNDKDTQKIP